MPRIKWIFFDIDNTLFDSQRLAAEARKNAVKSMIRAGLKAKQEVAFKKLIGIVKKYGSNCPKHFDRLVAEYKVPKEQRAKIIAAGQGEYHNTKFRLLVPFKGAKAALAKLKKNYKLGIISNGRAVKQWDKLIRLNVSGFFTVVVISEEAKRMKPSREIFKIALRKAGCKASEAIMIGDREDDLAASKIGMHTILFRESFPKILKQVERIEKSR